MTKTASLPDIVRGVYEMLEPLESGDRQKVIRSAMTLLGDDAAFDSSKSEGGTPSGSGESGGGEFGTKATRWLKQYGIDESAISEIFHKDGNDVEIIVNDVPGDGKRGKSQNCYLLSGVRSFLATDEAKFTESEVVKLCKHMGCHDSPNHSRTRTSLGNLVAGTKASGYTLPAPGLRAAAELIKGMSSAT